MRTIDDSNRQLHINSTKINTPAYSLLRSWCLSSKWQTAKRITKAKPQEQKLGGSRSRRLPACGIRTAPKACAVRADCVCERPPCSPLLARKEGIGSKTDSAQPTTTTHSPSAIISSSSHRHDACARNKAYNGRAKSSPKNGAENTSNLQAHPKVRLAAVCRPAPLGRRPPSTAT